MLFVQKPLQHFLSIIVVMIRSQGKVRESEELQDAAHYRRHEQTYFRLHVRRDTLTWIQAEGEDMCFCADSTCKGYGTSSSCLLAGSSSVKHEDMQN